MGVLLFPDFELLDVFGPLEMFGHLPDIFRIILISEKSNLIKSKQGIVVKTDVDLNSTPHLDILLIPGGQGTRKEVNNTTLINWLKEQSTKTDMLLSVCTGAALLAKSGVLDNRRATTNKIAFDWVKEQGPDVKWIERARWVDDGNIITSSGVAAGIDMSLAVIAKLCGIEKAEYLANITEYIWNKEADNDVFAKYI